MTTDVDICNQALGAMGTRSTIASLTEISAEATACALRYNGLRDDMLREAMWGFAAGTATLSLLRAAPGTPENASSTATQWTSAMPTPPWLYSYSYPQDCIRFRGVAAGTLYGAGTYPPISPVQSYSKPACDYQAPGMKWQQAVEPDASGNQGRVINTNVSQAVGYYTRRLILPDSWDPSFQQALIYRLAAELSIPLSGDKGLRDRNLKRADDKLRQVEVDDANEGQAQQNRTPDWIRIRGGGGMRGLDGMPDWGGGVNGWPS